MIVVGINFKTRSVKQFSMADKKKYRIRAVRPDKYIVEKKGWFIWRPFLIRWLDWDLRVPFWYKTQNEAKSALFSALAQEQKELLHISQPSLYLEM